MDSPFAAPFSNPAGFNTPPANTAIKPLSQPVTSPPSIFNTPLNFGTPTQPQTQPTQSVPPSSSLFGSSTKIDPVPTTLTAQTPLGPPPSYGSPIGGTSGSIFGGISTANTPNASKPAMFVLNPGNTLPFGSLNNAATKSSPAGVDLSQMAPSVPQNIPKPTQNLTFAQPTILSVPKVSQPAFSTLPNVMPVKDGSQTPKPDVINVAKVAKPLVADVEAVQLKEEPEFSDHIIRSAIIDEIKNFKNELHDLISRCKNIKLNVGTEEEKLSLVEPAESLVEFYRELQEITDSQVAEVHCLKQALIQSFAWYEDAKSRHRRFLDPNFSTFLISQDLDPLSEKQLADIQHLIYYINSQLKLVDGFLDNQWADFQDSCKKHIKGRFIMPTMEPVYQSMVRLNAILARQRYVLKDINGKMKIRNKKVAAFPHVMNIKVQKSIDTSDIDLELRKLKIEHIDVFAVRYEKIVKNEKKYSQKKEEKLCSFFTNRNVVHISPKKPKFSSAMNLSKFYETGLSRMLASSKSQQSLSFNDSENSTELNTTAEANLSSSNIFTFNLAPGSKTTILSQGKKDVTPKKELQQSTLTSILEDKATMGIQPITPSSGDSTPKIQQGGIFSFNTMLPSVPATMIATTSATKPPMFSSTTTKPLNFNIDATIKPVAIVSKPQTSSTLAFNLGSHISITPVSAPSAKGNEIKPISNQPSYSILPAKQKTEIINNDTEKVTLNFKANTAKIVISQSEVKTDAKPVFTSASTSQAYNFSVQPTKPIASKDVPSSLATQMFKNAVDAEKALDLNNTTYSFGNNLSLGQISTPKPKGGLNGEKPAASIVPTTVNTQITKPKVGIATPIALTTQFGPPTASVAPTGSVSSASKTTEGVSVTLPVTTVASVFKTPAISTPNASSSPIAGSTTVFGQANTQASSFFEQAPGTTSPSIFGPPQTTATSLTFGQSPITATSPLLEQPQTTTSTPTIFGQPQTPSVFAQPTTAVPSGFGQAQSVPATSTLFGQPQTSASPASIFGGGAQTNTTALSGDTTVSSGDTIVSSGTLLGPKTTTASTASTFSFIQPASVTSPGATGGSIFAGSTPTTTSSSLFGAISALSTTSSNGAQVTTTVPSTTASAFGSKPAETPKTTAQEPSFGFGSLSVSSSADPNKFCFGNLTVSALSPTASTAPVSTVASTNTFSFALPNTPTQSTGFGSNDNSLFGKPATTTSGSFLGQPICSPSTFSQNAGAPFGQSTGNIFAQKPATPNTGSVFGQSGASVFGGTGTTPTTTSSSMFMQSSNSPFVGTNTSTTSTPGSIFGQNANFGAMNTTSASTGSIFGQSTFGTPATTSSSFSFTQNASAGFGSPPSNSFGAKQPAFGQPAFSQPPAFGNTAPSFGASGGSIFGNPSVQQAQQTAGSFGSGFGSPPAFGSPPGFSGFGAPPTFGGSPAFASPPKTFGSPGPAPNAFGGGMQENSTFANLASQSTVGFGSLAQGQAAPAPAQAPQFSGGSQFSSWR